jgi:hypothetical protein
MSGGGFLTWDLSEIDELVRILALAADRPKRALITTHREAASAVATAARSTASSYRKGTGRLARSIEEEADEKGARIWADPREGFFLEYGSPNTGGPRRWLSGPAEEVAGKMGEKFQTIAEESLW